MGERDRLDRLHDLLRPRTYLQLGSRRPDLVARARRDTVLIAAELLVPADPPVQTRRLALRSDAAGCRLRRAGARSLSDR
jgi:hypothetical protein